MEYCLKPYTDNTQPNPIIYSNSLDHESFNYLSKDASSLSIEQLSNSYKHLQSIQKNQELEFKAIEFNGPKIFAKPDSMLGFNHVSITTQFVNVERYFSNDMMTDVQASRCLINKKKTFNYNDDNFLNLNTTTIYNNGKNCFDKFKNSNNFNNERVKYLIWRNWSKNQYQTKQASKEVSQKVLSFNFNGSAYAKFIKNKFSDCDTTFDAFLTFSLADQHDCCYGPLVKDSKRIKININEKITYENNEKISIIKIDKSKSRKLSFDDNSSSCSSFNSMFSNQLSINTISSYNEDDYEKPITINKQPILKSCFKKKCFNINDDLTLNQSKEMIKSYYKEICEFKHLGNNQVIIKPKHVVMFNCEIKVAQIKKFLTRNERNKKIAYHKEIDNEYRKQYESYKLKLEKNHEIYEEKLCRVLYDLNNKIIPRKIGELMIEKLNVDFLNLKNEIEEKCFELKILKRRNRSLMEKFINFKMYKKCESVQIKDFHHVDNLEQEVINNLLNFNFKSNKPTKKNSEKFLKRFMDENDWTIYNYLHGSNSVCC